MTEKERIEKQIASLTAQKAMLETNYILAIDMIEKQIVKLQEELAKLKEE